MTSAAHHKKILFFLCVTFVATSVAVYFGINYLFQTNKNIAEMTRTLANETKQQQDVSSSAELVAGANPDISRIQNSVVSSDGDVTFIEFLESTARSYNLQIVIDSLSLADDPTLAGTSMNLLQVRMEVKGSWQNIYLFTSRVEALQYALKINSLDVANTGNTSNLDVTSQIPSPGTWKEVVDMSVLKHL